MNTERQGNIIDFTSARTRRQIPDRPDDVDPMPFEFPPSHTDLTSGLSPDAYKRIGQHAGFTSAFGALVTYGEISQISDPTARNNVAIGFIETMVAPVLEHASGRRVSEFTELQLDSINQRIRTAAQALVEVFKAVDELAHPIRPVDKPLA